MIERKCKWCDAEFLTASEFCSDKCLYLWKIHQLENRNIELADKVRQLNMWRTCIFPDPDKTVESNMQLCKLNHQKLLDEMTPDIVSLHLKFLTAMVETTHEVVIREKISREVLKKHDSKLKSVIADRDTQSLPRQKVLRDDEIFIRSYLEQNPGSDRDKAKLALKAERLKEKAIEGFLKIPGMTRERALEMLKMTSSEGSVQ